MKTLNQIGGHARQGDTLLRRIKSIPQKKKTKRVTLALGEQTGHHHTFESGAVGFADDENGLAEFVEVEESATLTHQEHDPIEFPAGKYESLQQVEYSPAEIQRVTD